MSDVAEKAIYTAIASGITGQLLTELEVSELTLRCVKRLREARRDEIEEALWPKK